MQLFVDLIIDCGDDTIMLIDRETRPHGWALPGGFVDEGESPLKAAVREAREETGLEVKIDRLFHRYSFLDRSGEITGDTIVFVGRIVGGAPAAASDAKAVRKFPLSALPSLIPAHQQILADYLGPRPAPERPLAADSDSALSA